MEAVRDLGRTLLKAGIALVIGQAAHVLVQLNAGCFPGRTVYSILLGPITAFDHPHFEEHWNIFPSTV